MKLQELLNGIPCEVNGSMTPETDVTDVVYDTRRLPEDSSGMLFVCIVGFRADGHDRAEEAYQKGVRLFAAQKPLSLPADATVISAEDTRKFLALASANLFGRPAEKLFTVAITGTKGKTSTSFMLQSILNAAGIPTGVIGSTGVYYGTHFEETGNTTPESYLLHRTYRQMLDAGCKAVVIEAASQGFKLHRTYGIRFDAGIFTNFAPDHIGPGEHADLEEYLACKKQIFPQSKRCYVNGNDPHFAEIVRGIDTPYTVYGVEKDVPLRATDPVFTTENHRLHTSFTARCGEESFPVELGVPGVFSLSNAMAAIAVARDLNLPVSAMQQGLREVRVRGRMEVLPIDKPFTVIIDAAHEEFGCRGLFETIHRYRPARILSVFGCGGNRSKLRRYGMGEVIGKNSDLSIITSDNSRLEKTEDIIADILVGMEPTGGKYEIIINRRQAIKHALRLAQPGDCILLIGKGHETYEDIGGKKTPFDEKQIVLDFIAAGMPQDS
ncbi:MAG: UDP-N-acetylmuramoyl-L-alanyl-D-glutamate--2,6-diaminopimelate ligase [Oscillospiraceae bacterium]|nr:UDP-N-acetylmuramoyl-L-alanyl-D-glutamate--2,6-diaminopimelate ligase [Oscillospiraceae bacterium]